MTSDAPRAGPEPDPGTEPDEGYLERLLLLHPECDPEPFEEAPRAAPAAARVEIPSIPAPIVSRAPVLVGVGGPSGPAIAYDGDGWITVVPDEPLPEPLRPNRGPTTDRSAGGCARLRRRVRPPVPHGGLSGRAAPDGGATSPTLAVVLIISVVIAAHGPRPRR